MRKNWAKCGAAWCLALLSGTCGAWGAGDLVAGPMVGHVTEKSARIWMQLPTAREVTITCNEARAGAVSEVGVDVEGPMPFTCDVPLTNLKPNHDYSITVKLDGNASAVGAGIVIRTPPPAGEEATFSVAFGSGLAAKGKGPVFKAVNDLNPRAFFFLGNTLTLPPAVGDYPVKHRDAMRFISDVYSKAAAGA